MTFVRRISAFGLALMFCVSLSGCYGSFNLVRKVHHFNGDVSENQWVQELVFLGLVFIPVYGLASLGDAIIVNSIEFWSGENPVSVGGSSDGDSASRVLQADDAEVAMTLRADGKIHVVVDEQGAITEFLLEKSADGVRALTLDGAVLEHVTTESGELKLAAR